MATEWVYTQDGADDNTKYFVVLVGLILILIFIYCSTHYNKKLPSDSERKRPSIKPGSTWNPNED